MDFQQLVKFLHQLAANNNKVWFDAHRDEYQTLRAEFTDFVADLILGMAEFDESVRQVNPRESLFRINRDMRFSKDKSPYNTTFSAAICPEGRNSGWPTYYFHVNERGTLLQAAGIYMPDKQTLTRIRDDIATHPERLEKILHAAAFKREFGQITGDSLKRPPAGYGADLPLIDEIKRTSFNVFKEYAVQGLDEHQMLSHMVGHFKHMYPFVSWMRAAIVTDQSAARSG